jgi:hypothetical protein
MESEIEQPRQLPPDGRFAGTHGPDQEDIAFGEHPCGPL